MKKLVDIRKDLETKYPVLTQTFNGEELELTLNERKETLDLWADNLYKTELENAAQIEKEAAKVSAIEKLAALGLTQDEANLLIK